MTTMYTISRFSDFVVVFPFLILFRCIYDILFFRVSVFKIQIPLKTLFTLCIKYQQNHPPGLLKNILCETLDSQISRDCMHVLLYYSGAAASK